VAEHKHLIFPETAWCIKGYSSKPPSFSTWTHFCDSSFTGKGPPHTALWNLQPGHTQDLVEASNPPFWTATTVTPALQSSPLAFPYHHHLPFPAMSAQDPEGSTRNATVWHRSCPFNTCAHAAHLYWVPHRDTGYYSI